VVTAPALSLRLRLAMLVAVVVTAVIAIEGYLEIRMFERGAQEDALQAASATAQAVADDLELRGPDHTKDIAPLLHDFLGTTTPTVRNIAVFMIQSGDVSLLAHTSTAVTNDPDRAARTAIARRERIWIGDGIQRSVAAPIVWRDQVIGAAAVTVSLASIEDLSAKGRRVTLLFAVPAVVILTLLVDLLARRLVHAPIGRIRQTMQRAGAGEIGARAPMLRADEIGDVAAGLNEMLERLEQLQSGLRARVDEATGELRETNARLVESYQRVFTLREALARAEQLAALGQMAANAAHQIGTPLNLVSGYVQLMIDEMSGDPKSLRRLQTVEAQIRKVIEAVRTMLEYARRPALQREQVEIAALVAQVCDVSRPALRAGRVEVVVRDAGPLPRVLADPMQLELALLNLISNSLDAMPQGGSLEITLAATATGVRLTMADSGSGIPPDVLPRIFEPWVTTKPPGRGTGLGLSITRDVIRSHGGQIEVSSVAAQGTTMTIDLPCDTSAVPEDELCRES
jgi:signal transduction histidine kinase